MEGKYPVVMQREPQEVYQVEPDYYRDRGQGRYFDPYARGQLKSEYTPQYNYEDGWKWHS